jgi:glycosyltransferase involved in cell wall biosynthesis
MSFVYFVTPGGKGAKGGIGRMVNYIVRSWKNPTFDLHVIDTYGPGPKWQMPIYCLFALLEVFGALLRKRVSLLHVHVSERLSFPRKGLFLALAKSFRVPVVMHLHGADFCDWYRALSPTRQMRVAAMLKRCERIICLGEFWRSFVVEEIGIQAERIDVLHNAVPWPKIVLKRTSSPVCRFLFLGVVGERKGVPTLLDALAAPALRDASWHCVFAGNGGVAAAQQRATVLGLADRTTFLGWINEEEARRQLAQADVMVLPSRNEGLPMAILEAMSFGCAVVATPVGAITDAIHDGETGLIVPVGESAALAEALAQLVASPDLRATLGANAQAAFAREYEITGYNKKLCAVYRNALSEVFGVLN